jgi:hypothetical protein
MGQRKQQQSSPIFAILVIVLILLGISALNLEATGVEIEVEGSATRTPIPSRTPRPTRTATVEPSPTEPADPVGGCDCNLAEGDDEDDLDCGDFEYQEEAQACYEWCADDNGQGDVYDLKNDSGDVCPDLESAEDEA